MQAERCRFYERRLPGNNELVVVHATGVDEKSMVNLQMVEYNNDVVQMPFAATGLAQGTQKKMQKALAELGRNFVVQVVKTDFDTGFLTLDRRYIDEQQEK